MKPTGINQALFKGLPRGVIVQITADRPSVRVLVDWLIGAGLKGQGELMPTVTGVNVIVGSNL